jgi:phytanoyl-CoA hydroxylase
MTKQSHAASTLADQDACSTSIVNLGRPLLETQNWIDRDDADIDAYVGTLTEDVEFDLKLKLQEWKTSGFVVFENVLSHELIAAMVGDVEYLRKNFRDFELFAELRGTIKPITEFSDAELALDGVKFNSIETISLAAKRLSLTRTVAVFLRHVFGSPACVLQSLTFYKGSQQSIHIDYPYVRCQAKLAHLAASWIPLEDIVPDSGPLAYYPGSHRPEVSGFFDWGNGSILLEPDSARQPHEFSTYLANKMEAAGIKPKVFCPRKGDVLLWHCNLAHEGTRITNEDATRKSYVTHYTSLDAYPPLHKHSDAAHGAGAWEENGGFCFDYPWLTNPNRLPSFSSDLIHHAIKNESNSR